MRPLQLLAVCLAPVALAPAVRGEERLGPGALKYDLVLAKGATPDQPKDLVIGLHGKDGTKEVLGGWLEKLIPSLTDTHRVWVQSNTPHWQRDVVEPMTQLVRQLRRELPVRHVIVIGFSAGGFLGTALVFNQPETFDAALIGGATGWGRPQTDAAKRRPVWYSIGDQDGVVKNNGGVEQLRASLEETGYPSDRWQIDVVPGLGHTLDGKSLNRGLDFVRARLIADDALTAADKTALEALTATVKAKDGTADALEQALTPLLASGREARLAAAQALLPLLKDPDDERGLKALQLAERSGEPVLGPALAKAWAKVKKDEIHCLALISALGALEAGAGLPGLLERLGGWDHDGRVQLATATVLGRTGNPAAIDPLIAALRAAEKKKRDDYVTALDQALTAITGAEQKGAAAWQAWRQKAGKSGG